MTRLVLIVALGVYVVAIAAAEEEPQSTKPINCDGFELVLTVRKKKYIAGAAVDVSVTVKNVSDKDSQWFSTGSATSDLAFDVKLTEDGKAASAAALTKYGERDQHAAGSFRSRAIKPGECVKYEMRVNRYFDMSTAGKYLIKVGRYVEDKKDTKKMALICTEELSLEIVGDE